LFDPYEGASKFVEVYNRSEKNISLANWKLNDLTSGEVGSMNEITTLGIMLYPGEYLVLTESKSGVSEYYHQSSSNRLFAIADLPDYTSDDMVILLMPDSSICDAVAYNSDYHYPLLDDTKGVSLERIQADRDSDDATNWHSAASTVGYATPGYRNSQSMPTAITESSFGVNPSTFSPDNDGFNDQVQFNYTLDSEGFTGNLRIYDSEGRLVRKLMQNELLGREGTISWDGINDDRQKAGLGIYVIYFEVFNTQGKKEIHKETCVLAHLLN
jgi:hypothetical protein